MLLPEFDHESRNTRQMLESIPDEHLDYRPHDKSWTMRELATHVAMLGGWTRGTLEQDEIDLSELPAFAPLASTTWEPRHFASTAEIVAAYDATIANARGSLEAASEETFRRCGRSVLAKPSTSPCPRAGFPLLRHEPHRAPPGPARRLPVRV